MFSLTTKNKHNFDKISCLMAIIFSITLSLTEEHPITFSPILFHQVFLITQQKLFTNSWIQYNDATDIEERINFRIVTRSCCSCCSMPWAMHKDLMYFCGTQKGC